jgi:hypothetical protein
MAVRAQLLAYLLAGGLALAGGGSGSSAAAPQSAATVVSQMKAAVGRASSVHVAGHLSDNGQPLGLDLGVIRGGQFTGTITENGIPLTIIDTGGKAYIKATPAFLRELKTPAGVCPLMCGKYVETSGKQERSLASSLSMASLTRSLTGPLPAFADQGTASLHGVQALILRGADASVLKVAARGTPYPLEVLSPPSRPGSVEFTQWNGVPVPAAPPASQVIEESQLRH